MSKGALGLGLARALHLPPFALRTQALGGVLCKEAPTGAGGGRLGLPVRKGSGEFSIRLWGNATGRCLWHRPPRLAVPSSRLLGQAASASPVRGAFVPHPDTCVGSVYFKLGELQMTKLGPRYFTLELNI